MTFIEYADTGRPGTKLVSAKLVETFLNDTSYGAAFYVVVHAISPHQILSTPQFKCSFTLGTNRGFTFPIVSPSQLPDYPFISKLTRPDGTTITIPKSIDQNDIFPLQTLEGTIHFKVTKLGTERVYSQTLEIK